MVMCAVLSLVLRAVPWLFALVAFMAVSVGSVLRVASLNVIEFLFKLSGGTYGMVRTFSSVKCEGCCSSRRVVQFIACARRSRGLCSGLGFGALQVQCIVDVVIIVFYAACTCVGVYTPSRLLSFTLYKVRPKVHATSLHGLLINCAVLQTLSFALPVIVWIFGLGPREAMRVREEQLCAC